MFLVKLSKSPLKMNTMEHLQKDEIEKNNSWNDLRTSYLTLCIIHCLDQDNTSMMYYV